MRTFDEVYRQHVQAVFRFAMSVVGRKELAEDLTSEAFLALWRNFDGIDQEKLPSRPRFHARYHVELVAGFRGRLLEIETLADRLLFSPIRNSARPWRHGRR